MATIGDITAQLKINSSQWNSGLKAAGNSTRVFENNQKTAYSKINKDIERTERQIKKLQGTISGLARAGTIVKAAFAGIVAGRISGMITNRMAEISKLKDTASMLGIATDKLGGLRHAAEATGVATSNLDLGIRRMNRRISEAAQGGGPAATALDQLNLSAKELVALSPDQQFLRISEAMKGIPNQSDKLRLAFKLFDSDGAALLNTLALGKDGIQGMMEEAKKLGIALDEIEVAKVAAADEAMRMLSVSTEGLTNHLTVSLAPAIQVVSGYFTDWLSGSAEGIHSVKSQTDGWLESFGLFMDVFQMISSAWYGVQSAITKGISDIMGFFEELAWAADKVSEFLTGSSLGIIDTLAEIKKDLNLLSEEQWQKSKDVFNQDWWSQDFTNRYAHVISEAEQEGKEAADRFRDIIGESVEKLPQGLAASFNNIITNLGKGSTISLKLGLDAEKQVKKEEKTAGPRSLMRHSAEFFRAVNSEHGRNQKDIEKKQLQEQQKTNSLLDELVTKTSVPEGIKTLNLGGLGG